MCFIELQDLRLNGTRAAVEEVLARAGIPAEMIAVTHKFHDGIRARVRVDDGQLSNWFLVTQDLRLGCVLCPHC